MHDAATDLNALTLLMNRAAAGDHAASEALLEQVYGRLRAIAAGGSRASASETLRPTVLVHEAYLRLFDGVSAADSPDRWAGRDHFFGVAAMAMRQIAVDHARARRAHKRGGGWQRVELGVIGTDDAAADTPEEVDLLALDEALAELGELSPRQLRIVELRFFAGLTSDQAASVLGLSPRTAQLDWRAARAWLRARLAENGE